MDVPGDTRSTTSWIAPDPARRLAPRQRPPGWAVGRQRWADLLFLHWEIEPAQVQATLPAGLRVDTFSGRAYVGIVPFFMERIRPIGLPPVPGISWFMELNVRTYVHDARGRPGVWFYSLDCNQPLAVVLARRFFHLPYCHARMSARRQAGEVSYACQRQAPGAAASHFAWKAGDEARLAEPGTLEFFLAERYLLFSADPAGRLFSGRVFHPPYRLHQPSLADYSTAPAAWNGLVLEGAPVSVLGAETVDVSVFPLQPASLP